LWGGLLPFECGRLFQGKKRLSHNQQHPLWSYSPLLKKMEAGQTFVPATASMGNPGASDVLDRFISRGVTSHESLELVKEILNSLSQNSFSAVFSEMDSHDD